MTAMSISLTDFPPDADDDAWVFAEDSCRRLRLTPDIRPKAWCSRRFLDHIAKDAVGAAASDDLWMEVGQDVQTAARHFRSAVRLIGEPALKDDDWEGYKTRMSLMHAMQAGHTSLESALLRIMDMRGENRPTAEAWHADLIRRASRTTGGRPAILTQELAKAADRARRFGHVAVRTYDQFDPDEAVGAVEAAEVLAGRLAHAIAAFRAASDTE